MPTAPFILASSATAAIRVARARQPHRDVGDFLAERRRRSPSGRGCAPASAARRSSLAIAAARASSASSAGSSTSRRAASSISAWLVLLMSSLVQAKWMNAGRAGSSRGSAAKRSASQYSTALTSWLVVLLDRLDRLGVGVGEVGDQAAQIGRAPRRERLELGKPRVGQRDEPLDLDLDPPVQQAVFGEQRPQRHRAWRRSGHRAATRRRWGRSVMPAIDGVGAALSATAARRGELAIICAALEWNRT